MIKTVYQGDLKLNSGWKIGLVTSRFNELVTEKLELGAIEKFLELGGSRDQLLQVRVPGALEIPLAAKWLLDQGCDAVATVGAVIRGETTHYDSVCQGAERGCGELQLEYGKPVAFGVITTENSEQAMNRAGGKKGNKGADAVEVIVEMLNLKTVITQ